MFFLAGLDAKEPIDGVDDLATLLLLAFVEVEATAQLTSPSSFSQTACFCSYSLE
jgi:hypothetical protein